MNFFEHQEHARRQTRRMLWLFALSVCVIVVVIDFVVLLAIGIDGTRPGAITNVVVPLSALVLCVIGTASLYRIATLRGGGAAVAQGLGATLIATETTNLAHRRLRNVVEEIAIASGTPVPAIYVLEDEEGINAFAAGYAPADAAIAVTRGALDKLTRAELQGVIGHEFSHILNGDMRLNIRLVGVVFGLVVVASIGRRIMHGTQRSRSAGGLVTFGFALFAAGWIGVVLGRMIQASVSRQREFLADASAVQFTREPGGIAGALKKIGALSEGSKLSSAGAGEVAHMLFGDGLARTSLFATHPPLPARIRRLDPAFREDEYRSIAAAWAQPVHVVDASADRTEISVSGLAPALPRTPAARGRSARAIPAAQAEIRLEPAVVAGQVGNPDDGDHGLARSLHRSIPVALRDAARNPGQAESLLFALLLDPEVEVRERQLAAVALACGDGVREQVRTHAQALRDLHPMQHLPLVALTFPALRRRPRAQLATFARVMHELIHADARVTLREFCLARLVDVQVHEALDPSRAVKIGRVRLPEARREVCDLLAILARHGNDDEAAARRAYASGLDEVLPQVTIAYAPPLEWAAALDRALPLLDRLAPAGKELLVRALTRAIGADGKVSVAEAEVLRTVCAALHCPLPPLLQAGAGAWA